MKKLLTVLFAAFAIGSFAFAETYISANDLENQTLVSDLACEDGFVIHATPEKNVEISTQTSDCPNEANGEVYTKRIKLGGTGKIGYRTISFDAKAGQKITVCAKSSSKTDARVVNLLDAEGNVVASGEAAAYPSKISVDEFTVPADGTYNIASKSSAIYIYSIVVK